MTTARINTHIAKVRLVLFGALVLLVCAGIPVRAFAATIAGTLYQADGVTVISGKTINVSLAGGAVGTQHAVTDGSGNFSITFTTTPAAGNPVVAYVSADATTRAVTVTKAGGTGNITGLSLYQNTVIVRQENSATSTTIADFGTGSVFDSSIQYGVTGGTASTTVGQGMLVWAGSTFNPGAAFIDNGSFTIGSGSTFLAPASSTIAGNYSNSGTLTAGTGTINFTSPLFQYLAGVDASGTTNSGAGSNKFNNVIVSGNYAYVAVNGNSTACSSTAGSAIGCELQIYNISNPAAPTYVAGVDASGSTGSGNGNSSFLNVYVSGNYAYVSTAANAAVCRNAAGSAVGCELQIYNIANPAAPTYVAGVDASGTTGSGVGSNTFQSVYVSGNYAYVASSGSATACSSTAGSAIGCELQIYNISNPAAPTYVAGVDASGTTGSGVGSDTFGTTFVSGNYAYVTASFNATACSNTAGSAIGCELKVINVTTPTAPVYVAGVDASGTTGSGTGSNTFLGVYVSGNYAYVTATGNVTACSSVAGSAVGCELQIYNVTTPTAPVYVAGVDASGTTGSGVGSNTFNNVYVSGNYAYVPTATSATACSSTAGSAVGCELQIYNISNPAAPTYVAGVDASGSTGSGTGSNAFDNVYVSGNYVYVAASINATTCSNTAGNAIGCELMIIKNNASSTATLSGTLDSSSSFNNVVLSGSAYQINNRLSATNVTVTGSYARIPVEVNTNLDYYANGGSTVDFTGGTLRMSGTSTRTAPLPLVISGIDSSGNTGSGIGASNFTSVFVSGNYAYVTAAGNATACSSVAGSAVGCELQIYDISNPTAPVYVAGVDASGTTGSGTGSNTFNSVYVSGNYAYVTAAANSTTCSNTAGSTIGCELQIYNVTTPTAPVYVAGADDTGSTGSGTGNTTNFNSVFVSGNYAYVTTGSSVTACSNTAGSASGCELQIYNVTTPTAPTYAAGVDSSGSTGSGTLGGAFNGVYVSGNYAYVVSQGSGATCSSTAGSAGGCELKVIDVTTPSAPVYVTGADDTGSVGSGTGSLVAFNSVYVSGNYAYVTAAANATACSNTAGSAIGCELQIYNVTTPTAPTYAAGVDASGTTGSGTTGLSFSNVFVSGNYAYVAAANSPAACSNIVGNAVGCELKILDVTSPVAPVYIAGADASGATGLGGNGNGINSTSALGVFVSGDYAYLAKGANSSDCGLFGNQSGCELVTFGLKPSAAIIGDGGATLSLGSVSMDSTATSTLLVPATLSGTFQNASTMLAQNIGALTVTGAFSNSGTLYAPAALTLGGNYTNTGTAVLGANVATTFNGTITQTLSGTMTGTSAFGPVTISSSGAVTFANNATTTDFTISSGTVIAPSLLTINGGYQNSGAFNANGGTVYFSNTFNGSLVAGVDASGATGSGTGSNASENVFVSGNYAYVVSFGNATACSSTASSAIGCELKIYNISNPTAPVYIAGVDASGSTGSGTGNSNFLAVYVSGNYAYVTTSANSAACSSVAGSAVGCELQIYDVSNPAAPVYVAGVDASGATGSGTGSNGFAGIYVSGNYAYVTSSSNGTSCSNTPGSAIGCELQIYNVTTPTTPVYVAGVDSSGATGSGTGANPAFTNVYVSGNYAYITATSNATACSSTAGSAAGCEFQIYNISNPAAPVYIAGVDTTGSTGSGTSSATNFNGVNVSGNYAYVISSSNATACSNTAGSAVGCELQIYNVSNPAAPVYVAGVDASGATGSGTGVTGFNGLYVSGKYLYIASTGSATGCSNTAGSAIGCELQIYDISNPIAPVYVAGVDTTGSTGSGASSGLFLSVYASGNYAYVAANNSALACNSTAGSAVGCEFKIIQINKTIGGTLTSANAFSNASIIGNYFFVANATTTNLSIASGASVTAPAALDITGNYTNAGAFYANTGSVYLSGASKQTIIGTNTFYNLIVSNTSGTPNGAPSVTFAATTSASNLFTMLPGTSVQFAASATSTFQQLNWQGTVASPIFVRSNIFGSQWGLAVPATSTSQLSYVHVRDSNACAGYGNLNGGTGSINEGNNTCWILGLTVITGGVSFGFGGGGSIDGNAPTGQGTVGGGSGGGGQAIDSTPGYFAPTSNGSASGYTTVWTNASNAYVSDNAYATASSVAASDFYGFGYSIPSGDQITGIDVLLNVSASTAAGIIGAELSWNGGSATTTTNFATPTLSTTNTQYELGGNSTLWGRTWAPSELSDANLRLRLIGLPSGNTVKIDAIQLRVYHQASGGGGGGGGEI